MTPKLKITCIKKTQTNLLTYFNYFLNCILKYEDHIKHCGFSSILVEYLFSGTFLLSSSTKLDFHWSMIFNNNCIDIW